MYLKVAVVELVVVVVVAVAVVVFQDFAYIDV